MFSWNLLFPDNARNNKSTAIFGSSRYFTISLESCTQFLVKLEWETSNEVKILNKQNENNEKRFS